MRTVPGHDVGARIDRRARYVFDKRGGAIDLDGIAGLAAGPQFVIVIGKHHVIGLAARFADRAQHLLHVQPAGLHVDAVAVSSTETDAGELQLFFVVVAHFRRAEELFHPASALGAQAQCLVHPADQCQVFSGNSKLPLELDRIDARPAGAVGALVGGPAVGRQERGCGDQTQASRFGFDVGGCRGARQVFTDARERDALRLKMSHRGQHPLGAIVGGMVVGA